jgi:RNA polymerase sigma factor (sigma-70 family)
MRTDIELLEQWRGGNHGAGDELFRRHFEGLYRFFSNKVGADAADLVQRTFMACVEQRDNFREDAAFRTFLFAIAKRRLYSHFEAAGRARKQEDVGMLSVADLGATPSQIIAGRQEQLLLLRALREIPLHYQVILELHFWEKMTGPQLARILEVPEGTVRTRLRTARLALQERAMALAGSSQALETTMDNLERWAEGLREQVGRPIGPA